MMKTRKEIITSMCYTWRHDYGLDSHESQVIPMGMTQEERESLWNRMAQVFDHDILPILKEQSKES